eukprot:16081577-Heterocapsa_arctica.AAC.1
MHACDVGSEHCSERSESVLNTCCVPNAPNKSVALFRTTLGSELEFNGDNEDVPNDDPNVPNKSVSDQCSEPA